MARFMAKAKVKDWHKKPKDEQWVYGYYVKGFDIYEETLHMIFEPTTMFYSSGETDGWKEIDVDTLCFETGLTDKNGNKIFEGDIFKHYYKIRIYDMCSYEICVAEWSEEDFGFVNHDITDGEKYVFDERCVYEVIGNIFDNPELMKGGMTDEMSV